jgi:hypothetical protein
MHDSNGRAGQRLQPVKHPMTFAQVRGGGIRVGHGGQHPDIGTHRKPRRLGRSNDDALRRISLDPVKLVRKAAQHPVGDGVHSLPLDIKHKPKHARIIPRCAPPLFDLRFPRRAKFKPDVAQMIKNRFRHATASRSIAPPCPPPMHSVAMPRASPRRRIAFARCRTMRLPLVPTGWPSATAPPSTLSLL